MSPSWAGILSCNIYFFFSLKQETIFRDLMLGVLNFNASESFEKETYRFFYIIIY